MVGLLNIGSFGVKMKGMIHHSLPHHHGKKKDYRYHIILGAAVILIVASWWLFRSHVPSTLSPIDPEATPQHDNLDPGTPPPGFPNIFAEEDAQWLRSSASTFPNGKTASTRIYRTSFSSSVVYEHYLNSLLGWVIDDYQSLPGGVYFIVARGWGGALAISIEVISGDQSKVTITFIKDK